VGEIDYGQFVDEEIDEAAAGAGPDPIADAVEADIADAQNELWANAKIAVQTPPDKFASLWKTGRALGLDPMTIRAAEEHAKNVENFNTMGLTDLARNNPRLTEWLSKRDNIALSHDDVSSGALQKIGDAWMGGVDQVKLSERSIALMGAGMDPTTDDAIIELKRKIESSAKTIDESVRPLKSVLKGVQVLPGMGTALGIGLGTGAAAGATAVGSGAYPLVPFAVGGGVALGSGVGTARQETGAAYVQYVEEMKARGGPVDLRRAKLAAEAVGAINGLIEVVGFGAMLTFLPGLKFLVGGEKVVLQQSLRKLVGDAVLGYGKQLVSESVQEGVQQVVTDVGQNVALNDPTEFGVEIESFTGTAVESLEAFMLAGAVGSGVSLHQQLRNRAAGEANKSIFERNGKIVADAKLSARSPEKIGEIADLAVEGGHPSTVYLGTEEFNTLFQDKLPPTEAADQIGIGKEYRTAMQEGSDIAIPFKTYASRIANSKYHPQIAGDLKFDPDDMTARQQEEFDANMKDMKKVVAEIRDGGDKHVDTPAYDLRKRQLLDTGRVSERDADFYAQLHSWFVDTMGERTGEDVLAQFPLVVTATDQAQTDLSQDTRAAIETPEFRSWFQGSQITSGDGAPLVLYHGTRAQFDTAAIDTEHGDLGLHLTADPKVAGLVVSADLPLLNSRVYDNEAPARTVPLFVNMKNPLRLQDNGFWGANNIIPQLEKRGMIGKDAWTEWLMKYRQERGEADAYDYKEEQRLALQGLIKSLGYDGIVYLNRHEISSAEGQPIQAYDLTQKFATDDRFLRQHPEARDSYIVFDQSQMKSAIANRGAFDPNDPSVLNQAAIREQAEVLGRTIREIRANIGDAPLVAGAHRDGKPMLMVDGKEFLEANLDEAGDGWTESEAELQSAVTGAFKSAVSETGRGREVVDSLSMKMEPKPAEFWARALTLPNRARYWYEISAEYFRHVLPDLSSEELSRFIDVVAATSPQADPNLNIARAVSVFAESMAHVPVATDIISPVTVGAALSGAGLEGPKVRSFSGTMQYVLGLSKERPLSTNDRQVAATFGLNADTIGSNPVLYEVLSRFYINLRDSLNAKLPKGAEPYQTWQLQAMGWVQERYESERRAGAGRATSSDDYQQALGKVLQRLSKAGVKIDNGSIPTDVLMGDEIPNILSRSREEFLESPIATIEVQTLLTESGPAIKEAVERARTIGDLNSLGEFDSITKRAFSGLGKRGGGESAASLAEKIASVVKGDKVRISRVVNGYGTYQGNVGANIRLPMSALSEAELETFLSVIGDAWKQGAMAASSFRSVPNNDPSAKPWPGFIRTYQIFLENRVSLSNGEIASFSEALGGNELNVNPNVANGITVDINPAFGEDGPVGPDPQIVVEAAEKVFGAHSFETFPKNYKSTYIELADYPAKRQADVEAARAKTVDAIIGKSGLDANLLARYLDTSAPAASLKFLNRAASEGARAGRRRSGSVTASEQARAEKLKQSYVSRLATLESLKAEAAKILSDYERTLVSTWKPKADKRFERSQRGLKLVQKANKKADASYIADPSPTAPVSDRWTADRGAAPGEAMMELDGGVAAIVEIDAEGAIQGVQAYTSEGDPIAPMRDSATEAAADAEAWADSQTELEQPVRGSIRLMSGGRPYIINIGPDADLSTFLHETGHMFIDVMGRLSSKEGSNPQVKEDYETALKWMGYESHEDRVASLKEMRDPALDQARRSELKAKEEKWARGFEAFLMEGRAPAAGMIRAFTRFARWLSSIYKKIESLGGAIPQDIKDVMSRMIATDEQIAQVEEHDRYIPMFANAAEAGMTEEKFKAYQNLAEEAHWEAYRNMDLKIRAEQEREGKAWWKEERAATIEQVTKDIDAKPSVQASQFLRDGSLPPELESNRDVLSINGAPLKVSTIELDKTYETMSRAIKRKLGPNATRAVGGVHPDSIAQIFGFKSGDEMIRKLISEAPRSRQIVAETNRRMALKHGDVTTDGAMEEASRAAVHESGARLKQLQVELDALNRKAGHRVIKLSKAMLSGYADQQIAKATVRSVDPNRYLQSERKAATEAIKAAEKGKYDEAVDWQKKRMINRFLYSAAVDAKKSADKAVSYIKKQDTATNRGKLGKLDTIDPVTQEVVHSYLDQQDKLLERFEFKRISGKESRARQSLAKWVESESAAGRDPIIAPRLIDETLMTNWQDMAVDELLSLADAVHTINHQADRKNRLIVSGKEVMFDAFVEEGVAQIQLNGSRNGPTQVSENNTTWAERAIYDTLRRADSELVRLREIANELDGDDPNGLFHRILVHPFDDAATAEHEMQVRVTKIIDEAIRALPKSQRERLSSRETVMIPSIKQTVLFSDLIAFGLNMGNLSNRYKMLAGWSTSRQGNIPWTEVTMSEMRAQLTEADWDFIQNVWDALESMWPEASALEKKLTGLAPKKIDPEPFTFTRPDGTRKDYRGGYYPVIYDPRYSGRNLTSAAGQGAGLYSQGADRAVTPHGHLIDRIETYARPISLQLERVLGNVSSVIHDTTHREALLEAWRFLTDQRIADAMVRHVGEEYYRMTLERMRRIANSRNQQSSFIQGVHRVQGAVSASMMGFKMSVALQNFANVILAKQAVGTVAFGKAVVRFATSPFDTINQLSEISGVFRHRMQQRDNELRQVFEEKISLTASRRKTITNKVIRVGYLMQSFTNIITEAPAFLAAYQNAQAKGMTDAEAVRSAEDMLLSTFGGGSVKDLALVQDTEAMRPFTMFYGFFSAVYNMTRRTSRQVKGEWRSGKRGAATAHALEYLIWNIVVMNVLSELLSGRPPDDDDLESPEGIAEWVAMRGLAYPFGMVPFVRDIYRAIDQGKRDVSLTPLSSAMTEFARIGQEVAKAGIDLIESDELDEDQLLDAGSTIGLQAAKTAAIFSGLPVSQAKITGGFLWDYLVNEEAPENWAEGLHDLLYTKKKK